MLCFLAEGTSRPDARARHSHPLKVGASISTTVGVKVQSIGRCEFGSAGSDLRHINGGLGMRSISNSAAQSAGKALKAAWAPPTTPGLFAGLIASIVASLTGSSTQISEGTL